MYPYLWRDHAGENKYLFEVGRSTSLRWIMEIEHRFDNSEVVFATIDDSFETSTFAMDAVNPYLIGGRSERPFYFFQNGVFYSTKKIVFKDRYLIVLNAKKLETVNQAPAKNPKK